MYDSAYVIKSPISEGVNPCRIKLGSASVWGLYSHGAVDSFINECLTFVPLPYAGDWSMTNGSVKQQD